MRAQRAIQKCLSVATFVRPRAAMRNPALSNHRGRRKLSALPTDKPANASNAAGRDEHPP